MASKKTQKEEDVSDESGSLSSGSLSSDGDFSDSEEEIEEEEHDNVSNQPAKRSKTSSKFDLPSKEEQMHLRETQNLMTSNLLHLQVDEMLGEVHALRNAKLTSKRKTLLTWLNQFQSDLGRVKVKVAEVTECWMKKYDITNIHLENYTAKTSLMFKQPAAVTVVGSFALETATKPYTNIDLAVTMPEECFSSRDILNHIYFDKRKLYLAVILKHLKSSFKDTIDMSSVNVSFLKGDTRKPILTLKPNLKTSYVIRVIPVVPASAFKLSQLRPQKNNVRPSRWLDMIKSSKQKESEWDLSALSPTPHYNMAVLEDISLLSQHSVVQRVLDACPCARDAIVIAKVWLTQRGYRFGLDSLDGHGVALLVAYLFQQRTINAQMSSFTVFQCLLKFLSESDFSKEQLSFAESSDEQALSEVTDICAAVLLFPVEDNKNKVHLYNLFWRWSESFVDEVHETARVSLAALTEAGHSNAFNQVFMSSPSFFKQYDLIFHIPILSKKSFVESCQKARSLNDDPFISNLREKTQDRLHDLSAWQECSRGARDLIVKSLGDRAVKVHTLCTPLTSPLNSSRFPRALCLGTAHYPQLACDAQDQEGSNESTGLEDMLYVTVGILISTAEGTTRRVDRGPSATDEEACAQFTEFWGCKSRLRRFRDGTIVEAVVWGEEDPSAVLQADNLVTEIVLYSVARHMHFHLAEEKSVLSVSNQLEQFLPVNCNSSGSNLSTLTRAVTHRCDARTLFRKAVESLDTLRKMMTSKISDFPLIFEGFGGAHSSLRYTSFIPPIQHPIVAGTKQALNDLSNKKITRIVEPLDVIGSLSNSSRWPTELHALRTAKTALIIRLSKCIRDQFDLKSMVHRDYLDVFFQGFVFRVHLYTDQELLLLSNPRAHMIVQPSAPVKQTFSKFDSSEACQLHRRMVMDPLHHAAVRGLSSRFTAYGDTVRLMVCWRDHHFFSSHLSLEVIELIVASVFTEQTHLANNDELPCTNIPQSPTIAFLRSLIRVSQFNWADSILLVDFLTYADDEQGLEKTKSRIQDMNALFKAVKHAGHEPAMTVGAQYDEKNGFSVSYGLKTPDKAVVSIITDMAKRSADQLTSWMSSPSSTATTAVMLPEQNLLLSCNVTLHFCSSIVCGKGKIKTSELGGGSGDSVMNSYVKGPTSARVEIFSNISSKEKSGSLLIGRSAPLPHPLQAEVLDTLRLEFGHLAIFFINNLTGDQIGVRWKPSAFLPARFSVMQCRHYYISSGAQGGSMVLNASAVVAEMVNRANGLIGSVVFH